MSRRAFDVDVARPLTPADGAELADSAFEVFRAAAAPLVLLSAATNVPLFASVAVLVLFIRERGWAWGSVQYFGVLALLGFAVAFSAWLRAIGTGAMAHAAARGAAGHPVGAVSSFGAALRVGAALPLVCALRFGGVCVGLAACALPGVSLLAAFALAPHGVVLEGRGVAGAFGRAMRLATVGAVGLAACGALALAIYLVGTIQLLLATRLAEVLVTLALPSLPGGWLTRPESPWLLLGAAKVLADPFVSAAGVAVWMDSRIRADGIDLDLRIQALTGERPSLVPDLAPAAAGGAS